MQQFTNWTNLSGGRLRAAAHAEGRAAGTDYRVHLLPGARLPLANHPTLAAATPGCRSAGQRTRAGRIVQECGVGLVPLRQDGEALSLAAPPLIRSGPLAEDDVQRIARGLGVARRTSCYHAWCDTAA